MMRVPFIDLAARNARFADAFAQATRDALTRPLILGQEVERFERSWAIYCDRDHCVGTGNGYDAILLMLRAARIGTRSRVAVQTNAHVSAWLALDAVGADIVPIEPIPATSQMDAQRLAQASAERPLDAILITHMYGRLGDMRAYREVARQQGALLLVDASHAHGMAGEELGDVAAFSFYPTKNLGALGDAGAVVTNMGALAERVRSLRNYGGKNRNAHVERHGVNSRMDELQAAFLNIKLPALDTDNARRAAVAVACYARLGATAMHRHTWHLLTVRCSEREELRARLEARGIETAVHYPTPPHLQPALAHLGYARGSFPIAESLAREVVSIPNGPELTGAQVAYVATSLHNAVAGEVLA